MSDTVNLILARLTRVRQQRQLRATDPVLSRAVQAIKRHQHARFASTYSDFLADPGQSPACRFFLEELYGPTDFAPRDEQFARIVPKLVRLFPAEVAQTILDLSELHALTEELDGQMANYVGLHPLDDTLYGRAWRATAQAELREHQVRLTLAVGGAIDVMARKPMLRTSLAMMRGPAAAAGFSELQRFLESGLAAFRALPEPQLFLATIAERERSLSKRLFGDR